MYGVLGSGKGCATYVRGKTLGEDRWIRLHRFDLLDVGSHLLGMVFFLRDFGLASN